MFLCAEMYYKKYYVVCNALLNMYYVINCNAKNYKIDLKTGYRYCVTAIKNRLQSKVLKIGFQCLEFLAFWMQRSSFCAPAGG